MLGTLRRQLLGGLPRLLLAGGLGRPCGRQGVPQVLQLAVRLRCRLQMKSNHLGNL